MKYHLSISISHEVVLMKSIKTFQAKVLHSWSNKDEISKVIRFKDILL